MKLDFRFVVLASVFIFGALEVQASNLPDCLKKNSRISENSAQVLEWKRSTNSGYLDRGYIRGRVVSIRPDPTPKTPHLQLIVSIGPTAKDVIEVIHNLEFGPEPRAQVGSEVVACGDYITANKKNGSYAPSPAGAIVHWTHMNPKGKGHEDGFLEIDGRLYGQEAPR